MKEKLDVSAGCFFTLIRFKALSFHRALPLPTCRHFASYWASFWSHVCLLRIRISWCSPEFSLLNRVSLCESTSELTCLELARHQAMRLFASIRIKHNHHAKLSSQIWALFLRWSVRLPGDERLDLVSSLFLMNIQPPPSRLKGSSPFQCSGWGTLSYHVICNWVRESTWFAASLGITVTYEVVSAATCHSSWSFIPVAFRPPQWPAKMQWNFLSQFRLVKLLMTLIVWDILKASPHARPGSLREWLESKWFFLKFRKLASFCQEFNRLIRLQLFPKTTLASCSSIGIT